MSETGLEVGVTEFLVGVRLREGERADDYKIDGALEVHVGDRVVVEVDGELVGEVRRPRRELPEFRRDRAYPRVLRLATEAEARRAHDLRERERRAVTVCQEQARARGLAMKVVDVAMHPTARRVIVSFNAEDRVDFRELVRDLAREFRARVEMRQIGARDVTRVMDGIGPCGRQLCCSSHLRKFEPISVKMAKTQDMPLTDTRLLGNCGRLKCCLLYEFSLYEELRARLPRVNTPCQASCGGGGCMNGKIRSLRVLKQAVVVGFPDGTEAEVPLDQVTWEGRPHVEAQLKASAAPGPSAEPGAPREPAGREGDAPGRGPREHRAPAPRDDRRPPPRSARGPNPRDDRRPGPREGEGRQDRGRGPRDDRRGPQG